jgi:CRISPR-associated protein Cst1
MKRVYLDEWFVNAGLLGFKKVLDQYANPTDYKVHAQFIEFNPTVLNSFATYFFEVLINQFSKYDQDRIYLNKCMSIAENSEKFSDMKTKVVARIKATKDKVKKSLPEESAPFETILQEIKSLSKSEDFSVLYEKINLYLNLLKKPIVNDMLTINYLRSVLGNLFGQPSFLNPSFSGSKHDFIQKFHQDYVEPVIEECKLLDWIKQQSPEKLIPLLKDKKKTSTNVHEKELINTALKQLSAVHQVMECSIQSDFMGVMQFEEMHFSPLGLSLKNENIGWNGSNTTYISNVTKLLLFCSPVAMVYYSKNIHAGYLMEADYIPTYAFVNLDVSIRKLEDANKRLANKRDAEHPYQEFMYDILMEVEDISKFALQNTLFVEFSNEGKNCKLDYFHIPKKLALFFQEDAVELKRISHNRYRNFLIEAILKRKSLMIFITNHLRENIQSGKRAFDDFLAIVTRHKLTKRLSEETKRDEDLMSHKNLFKLYYEGQSISRYFYDEEKENQLQGISYRLLNACKSGNKQLFFDTLMRLYLAANRTMPSTFLTIFHERDMEFVEVGYSFITGLQEQPKGEKENV